MDLDFSTIPYSTALTYTILACVAVTFLFLITWSKKKTQSRYCSPSSSPPEAAGSWPIIGHLRLLGGKEPPHKVFAMLADQYGPIFKIRLGRRQVVVVSNSEMAKECLLTNDGSLATRPNLVSFDHFMYNCPIFGFAPYGTYWREMRSISKHGLLSNQRVASMMHKEASEVRAAVKGLYDRWVLLNQNETESKDVVEMRGWFGNLLLNMILQDVVGKSMRDYDDDDQADKCLRAIKEFFHLTGILTVGDALPYLRCLDVGGYENLMRKTAKQLDYFTQSWLDSHRKDEAVDLANNKDFIDRLIEGLGKDDVTKLGCECDADTIIKATTLNMIVGGSDTTMVTLTWALCLLLNNPSCMKKVQQELDTQVGKQRMLNIESDLTNLVYLQAVIKETLRLYPAAPLMVPHEAMVDVVVGGYHIPASTMLFVNVYKIHRDPLNWDDPLVFQPERFLTTKKHIDVRGQHFELLPFSSGRRMCPGISYALQTMHFTLASLIHCFDIATLSPDHQPIDMTESIGLTNLKATPLEVVLTPRLPPYLYDEIDD